LTSSLGSSQHAARIATGELARRGWPLLASLVGGHIASFGESCFQTYRRLSEVIRRPDGRSYHPESIARACRELRDGGQITSERVFVGGTLPTCAKFRTSSRGTTIKAFNWRAIEQKNPFSRRERRLRRQEHARELREAGALQKPVRPRHVFARAIVDPVQMPPPLRDPELERIIGRARASSEARQELERRARKASSEQVAGHAAAPERPPPE
jgi:hypothetical protein